MVKETTIQKIIVPSLSFVALLVFGYYGFEEVPIALTFLQAVLSANVLGLLIKHLVLLFKLENIFNSWIVLFRHEDVKEQITKYAPDVYRYWLQYETLHSKIRSGVPPKLYERLNPQLTEEWKELKVRYKIS